MSFPFLVNVTSKNFEAVNLVLRTKLMKVFGVKFRWSPFAISNLSKRLASNPSHHSTLPPCRCAASKAQSWATAAVSATLWLFLAAHYLRKAWRRLGNGLKIRKVGTLGVTLFNAHLTPIKGDCATANILLQKPSGFTAAPWFLTRHTHAGVSFLLAAERWFCWPLACSCHSFFVALLRNLWSLLWFFAVSRILSKIVYKGNSPVCPIRSWRLMTEAIRT